MKKLVILVLLFSGVALVSYGMQNQKQPSFCDTVNNVCWEEAENTITYGGYTWDEMIAWADQCVPLNGC